MDETKDRILDAIRRKAEARAAYLSGEFARVASEEKEAIFDALAFEKWLAESCWECLGGGSSHRPGSEF